jgi:hypothetical protein
MEQLISENQKLRLGNKAKENFESTSKFFVK